jgi:hypothetical protein
VGEEHGEAGGGADLHGEVERIGERCHGGEVATDRTAEPSGATLAEARRGGGARIFVRSVDRRVAEFL